MLSLRLVGLLVALALTLSGCIGQSCPAIAYECCPNNCVGAPVIAGGCNPCPSGTRMSGCFVSHVDGGAMCMPADARTE